MRIEKVNLNQTNKDNKAFMEVYVQEESESLYVKKRPLILLFPGGGYEHLSDREGFPVALTLCAWGYNVAVIHYSLAPVTYPAQYLESFEALKNLIDNSDAYNIDKERISVMGFSAGGHAAAMLATGCSDPLILETFNVKAGFFKISNMILSYPVITSGEYAHRGSFDALLGDKKDDGETLKALSIENRVTKDTPKAFIWSTFEDVTVPCENALLLAKALRKENIPFELHIFENGCHGLALSNELTMTSTKECINKESEEWTGLLRNWLNVNFPVVSEKKPFVKSKLLRTLLSLK